MTKLIVRIKKINYKAPSIQQMLNKYFPEEHWINPKCKGGEK